MTNANTTVATDKPLKHAQSMMGAVWYCIPVAHSCCSCYDKNWYIQTMNTTHPLYWTDLHTRMNRKTKQTFLQPNSPYMQGSIADKETFVSYPVHN